MGLFDGKQPLSDEGETAKIAVLTESPVLLVVDCSGMARSAAAIVHGFQTFRPDVRLAGVFANRVGSEGHFRLVKAAIEQTCGVPVVGFLTQDEALALPERHLGLVPSVERGELDSFLPIWGERWRARSIGRRSFRLQKRQPFVLRRRSFALRGRIACAWRLPKMLPFIFTIRRIWRCFLPVARSLSTFLRSPASRFRMG